MYRYEWSGECISVVAIERIGLNAPNAPSTNCYK